MKRQIQNFDRIVAERLRHALLRRSDVWDFLKTAHTEKDAIASLDKTRELGKQLAEDITKLLEYKASNLQQGKHIEALLDRCEAVNKYLRETQDCLSDDIKKIQKENEAKNIDFIKNATFLFGLPIGFVASVHNGFGEGRFTAHQATALGFVISIPIVFHKSFKKLFENASKNICEVPQILRNEYHVFYTTEMIKQRSHEAQLCFMMAARSINDNVREGGLSVRKRMNKIFKQADPKL